MVAISVVIPAYNQANFLSPAIQSVLDQSFSDFELVVVNDGSTDHTQEVLNTFTDSRLKTVWQENGGLLAARNTGVRLTTAPYVTFLDADDLFLPNRLAAMYAYLENHAEVGLLAGSVQFIRPDGGILKKGSLRPSSLEISEILLNNMIAVSGVLIRRQWIDRVGGFETRRHFDACGDWDLWLRLAKSGCQIECLDQLVVAYRIHPGQMTQDPSCMRDSGLAVLDKFFNQNDLSPELIALKERAYALVFIKSAARAFLGNVIEIGERDLVAAVEINPSFKEQDYKELVDLLTGWAQSPQSSDPEVFLTKIRDNLPSSLYGMKPALRKAIAAVILEPVFKDAPQQNRTVRDAIIKAISNDPAWLLNRGVMRRLVEAYWPFTRRIG